MLQQSLADVQSDMSDSEEEEESASLTIRKTILAIQPLVPDSPLAFTLHNVIYPFISGVMGGFGEMLALEFGVWMGWRAAGLFYFGRKLNS